MMDFLAAIASRGKPVADIEQVICRPPVAFWANISMQLGPHSRLGPKAQRVIGDDEANRLLRRQYRSPWSSHGRIV